MLAFLVAATLATKPFSIKRNSFGVPLITAPTVVEAFEGQGYADAQDRLWQMELSRRLSEGRLAAILGPSALESDESIDKTGYTKPEVLAEIAHQPASIQADIAAYCQGVNMYIKEAESDSSLMPDEFKKVGIRPSDWTPYDSAAIAIHLFKLFGTGGAANLRDWALLQYLHLQPALKGHVLDVFNDIGWINDPKSPTTVSDQDDLAKLPHPYFANPTDAQTQAQLKELPAANIFQLLPAINVSLQKPSKMLAMKLGVPYRTGSYCIVVGKKRSQSGKPILLSGPQMGLTSPSIDHEDALHAPGLSVAGMDIPGVPGIAIGATRHIAWGITSGVADLVDTFAYHSKAPGTYEYNGAKRSLQKQTFVIQVKGQSPVTLVQYRTNFGPVVLNTGAGIFALRSSYRGRELNMMTSLFGIYSANTVAEASQAVSTEPMSFNLFLADRTGNIGWRFCGRVPIRAEGLDPRLPTPATPQNNWRGFISADQMPHCLNPKSGIIYNWNTKPATWWSNGDTPVWGQIFRSSVIGLALPSGTLTPQDVEYVPWALARWSPNYPYFVKFLPKIDSSEVAAYNGWNVQGSYGAAAWADAFEAIRQKLFLKDIGNFLGTGLFDEVLQPTLMLHALEGKTRFHYLGNQSGSQLVDAVLKSLKPSGRFAADSVTYPGHVPVLYSNRGTYIQLAEIDPTGRWSLETVLPPGESETGLHAYDQIPLARTWEFKPTWKP